MAILKRTVCSSVALLALGVGTAFPLSFLRPGEPRIKFNRLIAPAKAEAGDEFRVVAFVTPLQNIWDDEQVFFHLLSPEAVMDEYPAEGWEQKGIVINANSAPQIPSQRWIVGEDVQLGPVTFEVPRSLAPGTYRIQMGLFYIVDRQKKLYMREPYANREIKDWIVGSVEVTAPRQAKNGGPIELILSDFETLGDVKKWESGRRGELGLVGGEEALSGNYSGCFAFPSNAYLPIVMMQSFFESAPPEYTDWDQYDYLEFLFHGQFSPNAYDGSRVALQIKDAGGGRFQRPLSVLDNVQISRSADGQWEPAEVRGPSRGDGAPQAPTRNGASPAVRRIDPTPSPAGSEREGGPARDESRGAAYRMRVPVADIATRIDIGNISHLGFWASGLPERDDWFLTAVIDDVKLVAEKGRQPGWFEEPFVVFEGLECPATASPGTGIRVGATFTLARKFRQDYNLFIHIIREQPPHFAMHVERSPFRSTSTWEVGRMHSEGPIYVPIPQDAPPGKYFVNVGLFKVRDNLNPHVRYVNTYRWSDGIYTEEQPTLPVDYIKQPYLNRNSRQQWTVGDITIAARGTDTSAPALMDEERELQGLIQNTSSEILSKPAPKWIVPPNDRRGVKRLESNGVPRETNGE